MSHEDLYFPKELYADINKYSILTNPINIEVFDKCNSLDKIPLECYYVSDYILMNSDEKPEFSFNYRDILMLKDIIIAICIMIVLINI